MSNARRILVVDDDDDLRESLKEQLALHDEFDVTTADTAGKGIDMVRCAAGEFLTVQEMGGFQMILARMDDELTTLWDAPCHCPALSK